MGARLLCSCARGAGAAGGLIMAWLQDPPRRAFGDGADADAGAGQATAAAASGGGALLYVPGAGGGATAATQAGVARRAAAAGGGRAGGPRTAFPLSVVSAYEGETGGGGATAAATAAPAVPARASGAAVAGIPLYAVAWQVQPGAAAPPLAGAAPRVASRRGGRRTVQRVHVHAAPAGGPRGAASTVVAPG